MRLNNLEDLDLLDDFCNYLEIFRRAVKKVKEINTKNGLPNDFVINGKTYYQLPNGEITDKNSLEDKNSK